MHDYGASMDAGSSNCCDANPKREAAMQVLEVVQQLSESITGPNVNR